MNDQQTALLKSLLSRTNDRKVEWQRTAERNSFLANVGEYVLNIQNMSEGIVACYALTIIDADGEVVETLRSSSTPFYEGMDPESEGHSRNSSQLSELFEMARRQAHGADRAIDKILQTLNS